MGLESLTELVENTTESKQALVDVVHFSKALPARMVTALSHTFRPSQVNKIDLRRVDNFSGGLSVLFRDQNFKSEDCMRSTCLITHLMLAHLSDLVALFDELNDVI